MGGIRQSRLAQKHRKVLEFFEQPENRELALPIELNAEAISLRIALFVRVFNYKDACEMIEWRFPLPEIEGGRAPSARGRERRKADAGGTVEDTPGKTRPARPQDPWNWFADQEYIIGSLWIRLLGCAWDFWEVYSECEFGPDDSPGGTCRDQLLARLRSEEDERLRGSGGFGMVNRPSVEVRLEQARAAAWRVVVQEVLKSMVGDLRLERLPFPESRRNPTKSDRSPLAGATGLPKKRPRANPTKDYLSLQARYDVERANLQEMFYDLPKFLVEARNKQCSGPQERISAIRKEQGIGAPRGLVPHALKPSRWTRGRNDLRLQGQHPGRITPRRGFQPHPQRGAGHQPRALRHFHETARKHRVGVNGAGEWRIESKRR